MFNPAVTAVSAAMLALATIASPAVGGPALLYDTADGRVLYAENADQPWYAASLTKMMTAYVVFTAWKAGKGTPADKLTVSATANSRPKMRLGLGTGKQISYGDAVKALIMLSANDIAVVLAEAHSGTEEAFVAEMNETAKRLGMTGTRFINANGLPGEGQHTTARDMALLAQALIRDYPEHLDVFSMTMTEVGETKKTLIATHNAVLMTFEGGDGLKTGFTCSAGYNIVASATRGGRRLVAVVLGEESVAKRTLRASMLLEHGFNTIAWKSFYPAPTIQSLPEGVYDRTVVRMANLDKRFKDCKDPEPVVDPNALVAAADGKAVPQSPPGAKGSKTVKLKTASVTGALPDKTTLPDAGAMPAPAKQVLKIDIKRKVAKKAPPKANDKSPTFSYAKQ